MTALLIGAATGLFTAAVIGGYRIRRAIALRQLEHQVRTWVTQAPPKVISIQDLVDAINFDLWESELEGADE